MRSALPGLVFAVPLVGGLLIALLSAFRPRSARPIAILSLGLAATLATWTLFSVAEQGRLLVYMGGWRPPWGIEWSVDSVAAMAIAMVAWTGWLVLAGTGEIIRHETGSREPGFYACCLLMIGGLIGMTATGDLFNLFVHLEIVSLTAYSLVGSGGRGAPAAGIRYLVIGSLGASLYLLGVGHLYAATGTLNIGDLAARLPATEEAPLIRLGTAFIAAGLAVKMGLFPLHGWVPTAYGAASSSAAALMAPLVTKVCAFALIRVLFWGFGPAHFDREWILLEGFCWAGAAAILWGGVAAYFEDDFRRLLAYSSVSQMGIVSLGIGLANRQAVTGALLHLVNDALMKGALFVVAALLLHRFGISRVRDLGTLRGRAPWTSAAVAVAGLSLVGVPPLCGFFGKWYVLLGALDAGRPLFGAVVVAGSLVTAAYVFRILERMYFSSPEGEPAVKEAPRSAVSIACFLAAVLLIFGVASGNVVAYIARSLPSGM